MLLAIDVGNTQTVFGLFDGDRLTEQFRVGTDPRAHGRRARRHAARVRRPRRARRDRPLARRCRSSSASTRRSPSAGPGAELLVLGPGVPTGIPIRYDDPREVGPDRIANAVAARERHGAPAIVVDFGTSTNFDVVSAAGEYVGGVLAPGIEVSMDALFARAARLPKVPFVGARARDRQDDDVGAPVGPRLRLRRPGRRDRRADPRRARGARRPGRRDRRPRRADRAALADDHGGRPGADARRGSGSSGSGTANLGLVAGRTCHRAAGRPRSARRSRGARQLRRRLEGDRRGGAPLPAPDRVPAGRACPCTPAPASTRRRSTRSPATSGCGSATGSSTTSRRIRATSSTSPANVPHQPFNLSDTEPATALAARSDPNEQESVELLPELEHVHSHEPAR